MKGDTTDLTSVVDKFGIPAHLIIDYLALMGDSSDNIPGMPGVWQKTALALLQGIGSIDAISERLDEVPALGFRGSKNFAAKFAEHKEIVLLSRELATIKTDVELPVSVENLKAEPVDREGLLALFKTYEFRSMIAELDSDSSDEPAEAHKKVDAEYDTVLSQTDFEQWLVRLNNAELFAFDTETTSLDYMVAELVGVSFSVEPGKAAYVPSGSRLYGCAGTIGSAVGTGTVKAVTGERPEAESGTEPEIRSERAGPLRHRPQRHRL